jgi:ribosomal protein L37AE/L43A
VTAWLVYTAKRSKRASEGYDDAASTHYSWDDTVPNHATLKVGDPIVVWDGDFLIGASAIEAIETGSGVKKTPLCPHCGKANVAPRKRKTPLYVCWDCKEEFDEAAWKTKHVVTYRSRHQAGWVCQPGVLTGPQLRGLCVKPKSQNALRELRWEDFRAQLATTGTAAPLTVLESAVAAISGGHGQAVVRVRRGQPAFRAQLLNNFGSTCAFTGHAPAQVLEAAHLYSYAANAEHHPDGGLLLRRDLHRLFDLGLIAVRPDTLTLDVSADLAGFAQYEGLHGQALKVPVSPQHRKWLAKHWSTHRSTATSTPAPAGSAGGQATLA